MDELDWGVVRGGAGRYRLAMSRPRPRVGDASPEAHPTGSAFNDIPIPGSRSGRGGNAPAPGVEIAASRSSGLLSGGGVEHFVYSESLI